MTQFITAKRTALAKYKRSPSEKNLQSLKAARSKVQQMSRHCANEYWTQLSEDIQAAALSGNTRGMYNGIKKALGPTQCKTVPLKSSTGEILREGKQMERWVKHSSGLYSQTTTVSPSALYAITCLPTIEELDAEPTLKELSKAIDSLAAWRAPSSDRTPARPPYCPHCMRFCVSAGKKVEYHRI